MYHNPFVHSATGSGAVACTAAEAAINVTLRDKLWEQAAKGDYLMSKLNALPTRLTDTLGEINRTL